MKNPLVSVPVITYNSSEYIIEGLESIKAQTYKNIELIISDDCSTDNTVQLCREWLAENKDRFVRTLLVTSEKNTGVAANCNRAIAPCRGEWIKMLSGDDKFLPYTIQGYIDYVSVHSQVNICFAKLALICNKHNNCEIAVNTYEKYYYPRLKLPRKKQYLENLKQLIVPAPGIFYKKALYNKIGGFDENYPFCEEDPFMLKIYDEGEYIYFIDKKLYVYRINESSLGRKDNNQIITRHLNDRMRFFYNVRKKRLIKERLFLYAFDEALKYRYYQAKSKKEYIKTLFYRLAKLISPISYKRFIIFQKIKNTPITQN